MADPHFAPTVLALLQNGLWHGYMSGVNAILSLSADSWPQALAQLADPRSAPTALALLNDVVDIVWHAAGDRSADLSWCGVSQGLAEPQSIFGVCRTSC